MVNLAHPAVTHKNTLPDVHIRHDERNIAIDQVGINDIRYPIIVSDREGWTQHTVAKVTMSVDLRHEVKGAHMSRFLEVLKNLDGQVELPALPRLLFLLKERLCAARASITLTFPYFILRSAPASGAQSLMDYECSFYGEVNGEDDDFMLQVRVPVTAVCPCSKEISDYGAHNQRSYVTIEAHSLRSSSGAPIPIWIEDLVEVAETSASAPVYPLLKRVDERYVTMQAYENPVFVEDIVRNVAKQLKDDPRMARFKVHVENHESIHNHNVFACVQWQRP